MEDILITKMSQVTIPLLDKFYPKEKSKERSQALILHAEMLIAIADFIRKEYANFVRKEYGEKLNAP